MATGTSFSTPIVAAAAYLAANAYYYQHNKQLTFSDFMESIWGSSEHDPSGNDSPDELIWDWVAIPQDNLGTYIPFYSYHVGYGSLDVPDLINYVITVLS